MYQVSKDFGERAKESKRRVQAKIEVFNGTALQPDDILSFEITEQTAGSNIEIGSTCSSSLTLECICSGRTFQSARLDPYIGFENEFCPMGRFFISDVEYKDKTYKITAYDKMAYLEEVYEPDISLPNTCQAVINDIANQFGFEVVHGNYPTGNLITLVEGATARQMIGYIAGLQGRNARFNRDGKLEFVWYKENVSIYGDVNGDGIVDESDVEYIEDNLIGTASDRRIAATYDTPISFGYAKTDMVYSSLSFLADVDEDGIVTYDDVDEIEAYIHDLPYPDTKVGTVAIEAQKLDLDFRHMNGTTLGITSTFSALICSGAEEVLEVGSGKAITFDNPFMTRAILEDIYDDILPFEYTGIKTKYRCDASWEPGDLIKFVNGEEELTVPIMKQKISFNGGLFAEIESFGETDEKTIAASGVKRSDVERKITTVQRELESLTEYFNNSQGILGGTYKELYGSDIDPSALSDRPIGFRISNNGQPNKYWQFDYQGLRFTENGGSSYKVGISNTGKIYADDIIAGTVIANTFSIGDSTNGMHFNGLTGKITFGEDVSISWDSITDAPDIPDTSNFVRKTVISGRSVITETLEASNLTLTGGQIRISTSSEQESIIALLYGNEHTYIGGNFINTSVISAVSSEFDYLETRTRADFGPAYIDCASGIIYANSYHGYVYLDPGSASVDTVYRSTTSGILGISSSLRKWKHDIEDLTDDVCDVHKLYDLPVRKFKWNEGHFDDEFDYDSYDIGFIAEEVEEYFPKGVTKRKDEDGEMKLASWGERNFIPAMLKLIQELHTDIENLKEAING